MQPANVIIDHFSIFLATIEGEKCENVSTLPFLPLIKEDMETLNPRPHHNNFDIRQTILIKKSLNDPFSFLRDSVCSLSLSLSLPSPCPSTYFGMQSVSCGGLWGETDLTEGRERTLNEVCPRCDLLGPASFFFFSFALFFYSVSLRCTFSSPILLLFY